MYKNFISGWKGNLKIHLNGLQNLRLICTLILVFKMNYYHIVAWHHFVLFKPLGYFTVNGS